MSNLKQGSAHYHSFLLRMWQEESQPVWRALLEETDTRAQHKFADLNELTAYLMQLAQDAPPESEAPTSQE